METKKIKVVKYVDGATTDEFSKLFDSIFESRSYVQELLQDCNSSHNGSIYRLIFERLSNCLLSINDLELFKVLDYTEE